MSSRALRRTHQQHTTHDDHDNDDDDHQQDHKEEENEHEQDFRPAFNPFDLLVQHDDDDDDQQEEEEKIQEQEEIAEQQSKPKKKRKKKRKKKKKKAKKKAQQGILAQLDDLEHVIDELQKVSGRERPDYDVEEVAASILATEPKFFNPHLEFRRIFGKEASDRSNRFDNHSRGKRKLILVDPRHEEEWIEMPAALAKQVGLERIHDSVWTVVFDDEYDRQQTEFLNCVQTMDPNAIAFFLSRYPFHMNGLLQMSEIYQRHGQHAKAAELIRRAVYRVECSFPLNIKLTEAKCRLSYSTPENRSIFLVILRHIQNLGRQGCPRTALEFSKLLLSFSPVDDPCCILLLFDYYAIRSREFHYLLEFVEKFRFPALVLNVDDVLNPEDEKLDVDLDQSGGVLRLLPNFVYSSALASFLLRLENEDSEEVKDSPLTDFSQTLNRSAEFLLHQAMLIYPEVIELLIREIRESLLREDGWEFLLSPHFEQAKERVRDVDILQKLVRHYVEKTSSLWDNPEVLTWLKLEGHQVVEIIESGEVDLVDFEVLREMTMDESTLAMSFYRKLRMADFSDIVEILPEDELPQIFQQVPQQPELPAQLNQMDPMSAFLMSLFPWVNLEN